jgi:hypothetical protein
VTRAADTTLVGTAAGRPSQENSEREREDNIKMVFQENIREWTGLVWLRTGIVAGVL